MRKAAIRWRRCTAATLPTMLLLCAMPTSAQAKDPQSLYQMECLGCHLSDGSGGLDSIPALTNHVARFLDVPGGREYLLQVPGVALSPLSDQELADVLNWMLRTFGPPEPASRNAPYSVEEIARWRKQPLADVEKRRAQLVLLMQQPAGSEPPAAAR
jgi:mono/diheme cytochrome c family protein